MSQQAAKPVLDPSSYTLSNGTNSNRNSSPSKNHGQVNGGARIWIEDSRWRFQAENQLPKPREFVGFPKTYRAGRGSSVPLDLSLFR